MVVIADTSLLNYLILIDADRLLQQLYGEVLVPSAVMRELQHSDAPRQVMEWVADPPEWLKIEHAPLVSDPSLTDLGSGESEAILLAQAQTQEVLLLMDEVKGRAEAASRFHPSPNCLLSVGQAVATPLPASCYLDSTNAEEKNLYAGIVRRRQDELGCALHPQHVRGQVSNHCGREDRQKGSYRRRRGSYPH